MPTRHHLTIEPSPKRVRVMIGDETIADSLAARLLLESGHAPVYYFPLDDVRTARLRATSHHTHCPLKGDASYWSIEAGGREIENAVWSYPAPLPAAAAIDNHLAFYWNKVDHWFEEDEEVFGHPRDPHHRIDVRPSSREVTVRFGDETIARTRRGLFLFETDLPPRYYIPPQDVRTDLLAPSPATSICPYKGMAAYWSIEAGGRTAGDAVWAYADPLPDAPPIRGYYCFYPEKVDRLDVQRPDTVIDALPGRIDA
ncbi:MAG TPA: DUF427 domain-containing protein [Sphingobium sp.]|nr:DUF427 domain-containing protein [Sphingobium sp.]